MPGGYQGGHQILRPVSHHRKCQTSLCCHVSLGSSGEIAYLDWGSMKWDRFNQCVYAEWLQLKTTKAKIAAFVAGFDCHICWFLRLGDFLILCDVVGSSTPSDVPWVFADLQMCKSPGIVFHLTVQKSFLLSFHACSKNAIFAEMHAFVHAFVQCFLVCMLLCLLLCNVSCYSCFSACLS